MYCYFIVINSISISLTTGESAQLSLGCEPPGVGEEILLSLQGRENSIFRKRFQNTEIWKTSQHSSYQISMTRHAEQKKEPKNKNKKQNSSHMLLLKWMQISQIKYELLFESSQVFQWLLLHNQAWFIPGRQRCFNPRKHMEGVYDVNRLKKNHTSIPRDEWEKYLNWFLIRKIIKLTKILLRP